MTIDKAIGRATAAKPGPYTSAEMIAWLAELDGQIYEELILTHEGAPETPFVPYTEEDINAQLLMPDPYSKLYVSFLLAGMDFYNGEYARYNNTQRRFEADYREAADWYNKTHLPVKAAGIGFGEKQGRQGAQAGESLPPEWMG